MSRSKVLPALVVGAAVTSLWQALTFTPSCTQRLTGPQAVASELGRSSSLASFSRHAQPAETAAPAAADVDDLSDILILDYADESKAFQDTEWRPMPMPEQKVNLVTKQKNLVIDSQLAEELDAKPKGERKPVAETLDSDIGALGLSKPAGSTGGKWLKGKGNAKRKKLEQNSEFQKWLVGEEVWLSEQADWGIQATPVSIAIETRESTENEVSGRGLVARREMYQFEELVRIPFRLLISRESAKTLFGPEIIRDSLGDFIAIALQVVYEKFYLKEKSFWHSYFEVIPPLEEIASAFTWSDEELNRLLAGSPTLNAAMATKYSIIDVFNSLEENLFKKVPEKFPPEAFTVDNFLHAFAIILSRSIEVNQYDQVAPEMFTGEMPDVGVVLCPYVDLINHDPNCESQIIAIADPTTREWFITVRADAFYKQFEQVYISYGEKSNGQLLNFYGFAMERNPHDFVTVDLSPYVENTPMLEAKLRFFEDNGITEGVFKIKRDKFEKEMQIFLRVLSLEPEDIAHRCKDPDDPEQAYEAMKLLDLESPYGETSERKAYTILQEAIQDIMDRYPTSIDEDEKLVRDRTMFELLPKNQRNAVRVRYTEKVILRATMATIDKILNNVRRISEYRVERAQRQKSTVWGRLGLDYSPIFKATNLEEFLKELDI